jgi:hypothetical protein
VKNVLKKFNRIDVLVNNGSLSLSVCLAMLDSPAGSILTSIVLNSRWTIYWTGGIDIIKGIQWFVVGPRTDFCLLDTILTLDVCVAMIR